MKRSPKKTKSRKISTENSSSDNEKSITSSTEHSRKKSMENESATERTANVKVRLQNTDSFSMYRNKNKHLSIENTKISSNFLPNELNHDDEYWLCEIPNVIDVNELTGKTIKLGSHKSFSTTDGNQIECVSEEYNCDKGIYENTLSLVLMDNDSQLSIKNVKSSGRLTFRQKLNEPIDGVIENIENTSYKAGTTFPKDIRMRHPLHGHEFKKYIDLNETIKQKLNEAKSIQKHFETQIKKENTKSADTETKKTKKRKSDINDDQSNVAKKLKIEMTNENGEEDLEWIKQI